MAWKTLLNTLQWPIWEENLTRSGYIRVHNWVTLLHTWNEHNFENQLYLTKKIFNVCRPFLRVDSSRTTEASSPQHTMCVVPVDTSSTACLEDLHEGWRRACTHPPGPSAVGGAEVAERAIACRRELPTWYREGHWQQSQGPERKEDTVEFWNVYPPFKEGNSTEQLKQPALHTA